MTQHVEDIDRGWKKIKLHMQRQARSELAVDVGFVEDKAEEMHGDGEITNANVATFQEYGTIKGIPERSAIRATIDEKHNAIRRLFERVAKGAIDGKISTRLGLGLVGEQVVSWIKARIRKSIPPPLKDATIRRKTVQGKTGAVPWIDTGQLIGALTYAVRGAGEGDK